MLDVSVRLVYLVRTGNITFIPFQKGNNELQISHRERQTDRQRQREPQTDRDRHIDRDKMGVRQRGVGT